MPARLSALCVLAAVLAAASAASLEIPGFEESMANLRKTMRNMFGPTPRIPDADDMFQSHFGPSAFPPGFPFHNQKGFLFGDRGGRRFGGPPAPRNVPRIRPGQAIRWVDDEDERNPGEAPLFNFLRGKNNNGNGGPQSRSSVWTSSRSNGKGGSSSSITNSCSNGQCKLCVNSQCFKGRYTNVVQNNDCPVAVCLADCSSMSTSPTDACPVCLCGDSFVREPCKDASACGSGGRCRRGACHYDTLPEREKKGDGSEDAYEESRSEEAQEEEADEEEGTGSGPDGLPPPPPLTETESEEALRKVEEKKEREWAEIAECEFPFECPPGNTCEEGACVEAEEELIPGKRCTFTYDCPEDFDCQRSSCVKSPRRHVEGQRCVFHHECPSSYLCDRAELSCLDGGPEHRSAECAFSADCEEGEQCQMLSCLPKL